MVMTEYREELGQYLGHRVQIRGTITEVRSDHKGDRVCIDSPEREGKVLCSHVWDIQIPKDWLELDGAEVAFDALVYEYKDASGRNFGLKRPGNIQVITPPAFKGTKTAEPVPCEPCGSDDPAEEPQPDDSPEAPPEVRNPVHDLRQARTFARQCGGAATALEFLTKLPDMPIPLLVDYLTELSQD
jgi:hypothetical protein